MLESINDIREEEEEKKRNVQLIDRVVRIIDLKERIDTNRVLTNNRKTNDSTLFCFSFE
jgi:hypothetical protein